MIKQLFFYSSMILIMFLLVFLMILISLAFLTLLERKFLSYIQVRKGPNKMGFLGIMQPFSDAIKLLSKEFIYMNKSNYIIYLISPMFSLMLILMMWLIYSFYMNYLIINLGLIFLMCCFSLSVYGLLMAGWSSNSSYSMLGSIRSLAQSISYEVSLSIIMIIPMFMIDSFKFIDLMKYQNWGGGLILFFWPLSMIFFFSLMAELNRTPFDFSEGESELVSGFNVEYSSSGFILIFLSEYASILFLSYLFMMFFMGFNLVNLMFYFKIIILSLLIIWVRGTMPRFRYDLLMYLCWLMILPFSLNYMFYMIIMKNLI